MLPLQRGSARRGGLIGWGVVFIVIGTIGTVWTGIGCCIARRWTRPIILIATGFVMIGGAFVIIAMLLTLRGLLGQIEVAQQHNAGTAPSPYMILVVFAIQAAVVAAITI